MMLLPTAILRVMLKLTLPKNKSKIVDRGCYRAANITYIRTVEPK